MATKVMDVQTVAFIKNIEERPAIWGPSTKTAKAAGWATIANLAQMEVQKATKKWSNLKAAFQRRVRQIPLTSDGKYTYHPRYLETKWKFYQSMMFLAKESRIQIRAIKRKSEPVSFEESGNKRPRRSYDIVDLTQGDLSSTIDMEQETIEVKPDIVPYDSTSDSDINFLMSLQPFFADMSIDRKLLVRMNILRCVKDARE